MTDNEKRPNYNFSWLGTGIAVGTYFFIKYVVVAQFFTEVERLNFFYNILLIIACMFFGRAIDNFVESRKKG